MSRRWQSWEEPYIGSRVMLGSCEPALEPDFQTLSIKLATAVMVHRAWGLEDWECVYVCVLYVKDWIRASKSVCLFCVQACLQFVLASVAM